MFKRKILVITAMVPMLFVLSNPSLRSFKEYIGSRPNALVTKKANYFVFSVYKFNSKTYIGAVGNFFAVKEEAPKTIHYKIGTNHREASSDGIDLFGSTTKDTVHKNEWKYDHSKSDEENLARYQKFLDAKKNR